MTRPEAAQQHRTLSRGAGTCREVLVLLPGTYPVPIQDSYGDGRGGG
jgi:hypothetical protein